MKTAKEFILEDEPAFEALVDGRLSYNHGLAFLEAWVKDFAKLHVEAALQAAADSMSFHYKASRGEVEKDVYPLKNIK